jgi:hypothetical protein
MATLAPNTKCMICGRPDEYEVEQSFRQPGEPVRFCPTPWVRKLHTCPPEAVEAFRAKWFGRGNAQQR